MTPSLLSSASFINMLIAPLSLIKTLHYYFTVIVPNDALGVVQNRETDSALSAPHSLVPENVSRS